MSQITPGSLPLRWQPIPKRRTNGSPKVARSQDNTNVAYYTRRVFQMRAKVTNVEVAAKLGVQHTTVSRWRSGDRTPSLEQMLKIAEVFDWGLEYQALSRKVDKYHEGLEARLVGIYGREDDDQQPTVEGAPA